LIFSNCIKVARIQINGRPLDEASIWRISKEKMVKLRSIHSF